MAPASPGLSLHSRQEKGGRAKGKLPSLHVPYLFILENKAFFRDFCLYLIGQNSFTMLPVTAKKAEVHPFYFLMLTRKEGKEKRLEGGRNGTQYLVTMNDTIKSMF